MVKKTDLLSDGPGTQLQPAAGAHGKPVGGTTATAAAAAAAATSAALHRLAVAAYSPLHTQRSVHFLNLFLS